MISTIVSRLVILVFGTLYPAYASYKAVRTKNVKEYVKWMMYWIVFALFTCAETFTDVFLSWFPFYYEIKIILVLWLLSPATKGSSILYRKFVHPMLSSREQEIDDYIAKAKEQGYHTVLHLGTKGVNYATTVIMQTAIKGGGGLVNQLRKSYSLSDLSSDTDARADSRGLQQRLEESEDVVDSRVTRRRRSPHRSSSGSGRVDIFFPEMDVRPGPSLGHVRSIEDVSSGYSSAEPLYVGQPAKVEAREGLVRTASVGGGSSRLRTRTTRTGLTTKKTNLPEDSEYSEEAESGAKKTTVQRTVKVNQKKTNQVPETREGNGSSDTSSEFLDSLGFPEETDPSPAKEAPEKSIAPGPSKTEVRNFDSCNVEIETHQESLQELVEDSIESVLTETENINLVIDPEKETTETVPSNNDEATIENVLVNTEVGETLEISNAEERQDSVQKSAVEAESYTVVQSEIKESTDIENLSKNELPETEVKKQNEEYELNKEDPVPVSQNLKSDVVDSKIITGDNDTQNNESKVIPDTESVERGGRYNKPLAPIPPTDSPSAVTTTQESHPIKATLILKPGVIKSLAPLNDTASSSEIFLAHSPKSKRKSGSQKKHESPISRLMMLPKKLWGHKNVDRNVYPDDNKTKDKRQSWHVDASFLIGGSHSKSDNEGYDDQSALSKVDRKATSAIDINNYNENKLFLRNLSHSPKQYRRTTTYNPDDYDDSD